MSESNENGNGKRRLTFIYTILGVIIWGAIIIGGFWQIYAVPQTSRQARLEINEWWDCTGTFKVEKIADAICEKRLVKMEDKLDAIYRMNMRRLTRNERLEFEIDTITGR